MGRASKAALQANERRKALTDYTQAVNAIEKNQVKARAAVKTLGSDPLRILERLRGTIPNDELVEFITEYTETNDDCPTLRTIAEHFDRWDDRRGLTSQLEKLVRKGGVASATNGESGPRKRRVYYNPDVTRLEAAEASARRQTITWST
jgi:hypothetical protein